MIPQYKKLLKHLETLYPDKYITIEVAYKSYEQNISLEYKVYVESNIMHKCFRSFKKMQEWILEL